MTKTPTRSLTAAMATSAVLAVLSTPALAQDTAPAPADTILVTPQSSAPTALPGIPTDPAPVIPAMPEQVIAPPPVMVSPVSPQPLEVVETVSAPEPTTAKVANREPVAKPASARNTPTAEAPVAADAGSSEMSDSAETALIASITASPAATSAEPAQPAAPDPRSNGLSDEAIAGLLALLGIGAAGGLLAMRRRKASPEAPVRQNTAFASEVPPPAPPLASAATIVTRGPDRQPEHVDTPAERYRPRSSRKAVHEAALAQMAEGPVPTGHERAELIRAMTRAKPDRSNPFTSPKARRRRARLILQHRERLWEERVTDPLDLGRFQPARRQAHEHRELVDA